MTVSPATTSQHGPSSEAGEDLAEPRCAVCEHRLRTHDAVGLRYCHATQAQALPRNCICRDQ
ncbi:MAG TPA: RGCVC family protein [Mycobacterium sp.]|jgi:hypothetical protein|nr:RGCVC family protein [Mycobacterium sp.]